VNEEVAQGNGSTNGSLDDGSTSASKSKSAELLREVEKFSRKKIEQLAIIKEANILLSLSDNYVSIHDLHEYKLIEQLAKTKGSTVFAVTSNIVKDKATGIASIVSRLAVVAKRRLLIWHWHDMEMSSDSEVTEIPLSSSARTISWVTGNNLVCGLNTGYVFVDIETLSVTDIMAPPGVGGAAVGASDALKFGSTGGAGGYISLSSWGPKPLITRLGEEEVLLAKDINSLFISPAGEALPKRQVPWTVAPDAISYSYPYLISLHPTGKGSLEIRNPKTQNLMQQIPLLGASLLQVPNPGVSLAHAGKGFLVSSDRAIWRMGAVEYSSQVDTLVEGAHLDEAISLLDMLEDPLVQDRKAERIREVKMLKAQKLFDERKYRASLDLFTEVSAPPERVIRLYPRPIAGDLTLSKDEEKTDDEAPEEEERPDTSNGEKKDTNGSSEPTEEHRPSAVGKFLSIGGGKNAAASDASSIHSSQKPEDSDTGSTKGKISETISKDKVLEGKDLRDAVLELRTFLVDTRTKLQRYILPDGTITPAASVSPSGGTADFETLLVGPSSKEEEDREQKLRDTAKLVDTTLFRCYMLASPSLAGSLFRIPNHCDPDVVNEKLLESERYNDLVDFFAGKKLHREALELLKKFGQGDSDEEKLETLKGPRRTVAYLQNLGPDFIPIVIEFAEWPLKADPDLGMEIFTADTENAETLPREKVVDFLESLDSDGKELAIRYLEHIINELNDTTAEFHNKLLNLYLDMLKANKSGEVGVLGRMREKITGKTDTDAHDAERKELLEKLLGLLKGSGQYSTAKALGRLPRDGKLLLWFLSLMKDVNSWVPATRSNNGVICRSVIT
jgi:Vam6/Vps39-like protein vacuolar protein sorting-associated protein 39